jgi:DHA2 family methylenomycin A resistance protein-like MFS transporter
MTTTSTGDAQPPRRARAATLIAASLGFGVIQLDVTVVNVAVKPIGDAFGGGVSELQWVISAYTLMFAALILTAGALADRFGARRVFTVGFVTFVLSSISCGLAPSIGILIGARAIQGAGAALLGSCSLALLNHTFHDPTEHARAVGRWAAGASAALSGGPVVGGVLIATLGWRSIFFINLPIGLLGLWLTRAYAQETPRAEHRAFDIGGQVAAVVALAAFAAALIEAGPLRFADHWVLAGFALCAVAGCAFVVVEARSRAPMLPLSLFRRPAFLSPTLIGMLVNVCFYGLIFLFSLLFQSQHRMSALQTGLAFLPMTAAIIAANLLSGRLSRRIGAARTVLTGVIAMLTGCVGLLWISHATGYGAMLAQQLLLGGGLGLLVPPMTATLLGSVERSRSGVASGTLTTMRQTGSMLGVALFGTLIAANDRFFAALHAALLVSIAALLISAMLTPMLPRRQRRAHGFLPNDAASPPGRTATAARSRA